MAVDDPGNWDPDAFAALYRRHEQSMAAFRLLERYPGDQRIDPGNYVWVSPIEPGQQALFWAPNRG